MPPGDEVEAGPPRELALFPLQSVLFPGAILQVKVFEPRYIDLIGRCMRGEEPFGVVCLSAGRDVGRDAVRFESAGVFAHIAEVEAEGTNLLRVRCAGGERFEIGRAHV
jgi:Lon protease-like protein